MKIRISDHAILRYLERHYNLDMDEIKKEILPDKIKALVEAGATRYTVNGMEFRIDGGVIVTAVQRSENFQTNHKKHNSNNKKKRSNPYYRKGKLIKG